MRGFARHQAGSSADSCRSTWSGGGAEGMRQPQARARYQTCRRPRRRVSPGWGPVAAQARRPQPCMADRQERRGPASRVPLSRVPSPWGRQDQTARGDPSRAVSRAGQAGWPSGVSELGQLAGSANWAGQAEGPSCRAPGSQGPAPRRGLRRPRGARRPGAMGHAVRHRGPRGSAAPAGAGWSVAARGGDPMPARAGPSSRPTSRRSTR